MVRIGVVGCGVIHGTHCDTIGQIEGAKLTAVYDSVPERAKETAEKYGVPAVATLEEMWDHVDSINVCVPSGLHGEIGVQAAKAGKHVLVEKPIDVTLEAATRLVETCEKAGVKLGCISQHRFAKDIRTVHDAAQNGDFGRLLAGDSCTKWYRSQAYYDSGDWRGTWALDGGGCLMNQGVHYVDMIQWIMGGVKAVQSMTRTAAHQRIEVEDIANALVEYKNGAIGVIQGSTSFYPGQAERIEVFGLHGSATIEGDKLRFLKIDPEGANLGLYGDGINKQPTPKISLHEPQEAGGSGASDPTAIWSEQHRMQIEDFVQSIVDDRDPFVTGRAALEPLKVILAIYESAKKGGARVEIA